MLKPQHESVGKWISTLDRYFQMFITRNLRNHAIGPGQLHFLMLLYQKDGVSQNELSQKLFVDKATAARAIQILEDVGYVMRIPSDKDRRINHVYLTDKAIEIRKDIQNTLHKWTDLLTQNMSQEEKTVFTSLLKKSTSNAVHHINDDIPFE